jgi:hypothetical protein
MTTFLYIGIAPEPDGRTKIEVSQRDYQRIYAVPRESDEPVSVHDHITSATVRVRHADCGLSCRCALEFVR